MFSKKEKEKNKETKTSMAMGGVLGAGISGGRVLADRNYVLGQTTEPIKGVARQKHKLIDEKLKEIEGLNVNEYTKTWHRNDAKRKKAEVDKLMNEEIGVVKKTVDRAAKWKASKVIPLGAAVGVAAGYGVHKLNQKSKKK